MSNDVTILYIIDKAIEKEIEAQNMYRELGEASTEAAAKDMFRQLTAVEKKHEDLLRRYLAGDLGEAGLKKDAVLDYRIAEHFNAPEVTPGMALADVLLLAANRERASHELYAALAAAQPEGTARQLFEDLAAQELDHKHRMEDYYTDVAFPQTSGG
jgi:rubrerythrin